MPGSRISWVLFDLNGTLLDPGAMAAPLGGGAEDRRLVTEAFHDALLLMMADRLSGGVYRPLPEYLRASLERALRAGDRDLDGLEAAMQQAAAMPPFPEAGSALSRLRAADLHVGVLTNSTTEAAERALTACGLRDTLEVVIGGDEVQTFKPDPRLYAHAVARLEVDPAQILLVAAHGWDVMGAMRAGLRGAWIARGERWLVPIVPAPDATGEDLEDVAGKIVTLQTSGWPPPRATMIGNPRW